MNASGYVSSGVWLNGKDLGVNHYPVTIEAVTQESIKDRDSGLPVELLCVAFVGKEKKLLMRSINLEWMINAFGEETDGWIGQSVTLFAVQTGLGPGVRMMHTAAAAPPQPPPTAPAPQPQEPVALPPQGFESPPLQTGPAPAPPIPEDDVPF